MVVSPKANKPSNDPLITNIVVLYIYISCLIEVIYVNHA